MNSTQETIKAAAECAERAVKMLDCGYRAGAIVAMRAAIEMLTAAVEDTAERMGEK